MKVMIFIAYYRMTVKLKMRNVTARFWRRNDKNTQRATVRSFNELCASSAFRKLLAEKVSNLIDAAIVEDFGS